MLILSRNVEGNLVMFLAIDVGGTKTLVTAFTQNGKISKSIKLKTPKDYDKFLSTLSATLIRFNEYDFNYACIAIPGKIDRKNGVGIAFGNLKWEDIPIKKDLKSIVKCPIVIENDANIAGIYESRNIIHDYKKVIYLTISTGIGSGVTINGILDPELIDSEAGQMMIQYGEKTLAWERIASGSAIKNRYGKIAADIKDKKTWQEICHRFAIGISALIATIQPDAIVIGGGVGTHFKKYGAQLNKELKKLSTPLPPVPPILQANKPEEAVIYGCFEVAKDSYEESRK